MFLDEFKEALNAAYSREQMFEKLADVLYMIKYKVHGLDDSQRRHIRVIIDLVFLITEEEETHINGLIDSKRETD